MKKALIVVGAVVLPPALLVSLAVLAAADWQTIGHTEAGHKISVSSVRVLKNNQRTALVRVEYKEPTKLPQGGPFVEMRARGWSPGRGQESASSEQQATDAMEEYPVAGETP